MDSKEELSAPESQGQNLALTVLRVPHSLDSGGALFSADAAHSRVREDNFEKNDPTAEYHTSLGRITE